jgi:hypothetical protein
MHRVEKDHIKNGISAICFGVAGVHDELDTELFRWLGQLARHQPDVTAPKRLPVAWIATPLVVVDTTHCPSASAKTLHTILGQTSRPMTSGRLEVVEPRSILHRLEPVWRN